MANTFLLPAVCLYKSPHFTAYDSVNNTISINADRVQAFTPRNAWVKRYIVPGQNQVQVLLTFEPSSAELTDPNTLQGVYIEQDGQGAVVDSISIANLTDALNGVGSITRRYAAGVPLFVTPTTTAYCLVRSDDGSSYAHGQVTMQYVGQYYGNVIHRSYFSGVSHYTLYSFQPIVPQLNIQPGVPAASAVVDVVTTGACSS
jgi:hypothetical protein